MRTFAALSALAICTLTLAAPSAEMEKPATSPRRLSTSDAEQARQTYARAVTLRRQGKFVEAQGPVREILDLYTRVLGEDHFETGNCRRELETLKKLAALPEPDRVEYARTYALHDEMTALQKKGRYADALRPAEQILDTYRRLLGPHSSSVAVAASQYGQLLHYSGRYADAEAQFRLTLRIVRAVGGDEHPATASAYDDLSLSLDKQGRYAEARPLHERAVRITAQMRGEDHPDTAVARNNLATHLQLQGDFAAAEVLLRQVLHVLQRVEGDNSARVAIACNNLAYNLHQQGKYDEAEPHYQAALKIRLKVSGEDHPSTGGVYMNLAANREARGDFAEAEPLYRRALATYRKKYGDDHPETAWALNNLAVNLDYQGKCAEAEPLLRAALDVAARAPGGEKSRPAAVFCSNLASCLQGQARYAEAQALSEKALAILSALVLADHPVIAVAHNNVAASLTMLDRYPEAEGHFREQLRIVQARLGEGHPETAMAHGNLSVNLYHQGKYAEAEPHLHQALDVQRRVLGEGHPSTAWTYKNLVGNLCARGAYAQAEALAPAAAASFEAARRRVSFAGLDRARGTADISPLPALAALATRAGKSAAAWQALEQNLARGLLDDVSARPLNAEDRRREQELLGRLDLLDRQVAAHPAADEWRRQRDAAQTEFVRFQADLAARYGVAAGKVDDLRDIQARLREDAALLAWVDLTGRTKEADPRGDHWACLVRKRGLPVWVRLPGSGPEGAWTDEDDRLASRTRRAFATRPGDASPPFKDLARRLYRQRLAPLDEHLQATDNLPAVGHVIVLPSAHMAGVPLEALTEQLSVSYAPSGTMFAWLQERRPGSEAPSASLLAVGDPAFQRARDDGGLAKVNPPGAGRARDGFAPLPGTRRELLGIARVFSKTQLLMGARASAHDLDQLAASGGLRAFRYLHFATHGVLDDKRPLRSALILAPDRPPDLPPALDGKQPPDSRLTAERILRGWKLDADLVTLSACDTALGKYSGGEGYLGFSQALFLAGARSLVLSLWQVDDAATALLMARFYENLLGTPEGTVKPTSKAEALAEAKRWLRRLGPEEVRLLTKDLPTRGTRGRVEPRAKADSPAAVASYEHPYYWSGFILVGDPR
jgi:CHAT domain-containing protein/tetratricopeptide (TPR) repeat protein